MKKFTLFATALLLTLKTFAQDVALDASLTESPVKLKTLSGSISGSLVVPKNASGKIPVVLIVADAGATDRNGNNAKTGVSAYSYKLLANDLGKKGIASLRYDKRLVGESVSINKESQLHFEDYSDDAVSLINMLSEDERFSKVIEFGHGEGSLVAMIAAYDNQSVKGIILADGYADKGEKILADEMKTKPKLWADEFKTIMDSLKKGKTTDNIDPSLYFIARPSVQPFLMSWSRYDPLRVIKKMKAPILILQGTADVKVAVDNGDRLKKAKSDAVYLTIKDMSHILKEGPADTAKNIATYSDASLPLKKELVTATVDFVTKVK